MDEETSRIVRLANEYYGAFFKYKNRHIMTTSGKLHETCDEIGEDIYDWADALIERAFGIVDERPTTEVVGPIIPNTTGIADDVVEVTKVLTAKTLALRDYLGSSTRYVGIVNELEDYVSKLDWYVYMLRLC